MQIINGIYYFEREGTEKDPFGVRLPKGYPLAKPCPVWLIIHGVGETADGTLDQVRNVMEGTDFDGPTGPRSREDVVLYQAFRDKADQLGHILVVVNYKDQFNPNDVDYVMDIVERDFNVDRTREAIIGFSLGGGAVLREITSSLSAARRWALAVACAPVNWASNIQNIVDAKLQLIGTSYATDPRVASGNIKGVISKINNLNPEIKPVYVEYAGNAHGGMSEIQQGKGTVQHIMDYLESVSTENRKQYPTSAGKPADPVDPKPGTITAIVSSKLNGNRVQLIGSNSIGWKTGYEGTWALDSAPAGVKTMQVFPKGASFINADAVLPVEGEYVFEFTLKVGGEAKAQQLKVSFGTPQPAPKTLTGFDSSTDQISWSDGTTEKGTAVYADGKWVMKDSKGTLITL